MLYARVVVGLPVEGPFDYIVPPIIQSRIKSGCRVWVSFGTRKLLGYVVGLSKKTNIRNLKPLLALIDEQPILDGRALGLSKALSQYYCCSWGEAIETALPEPLRKGAKVSPIDWPQDFNRQSKAKSLLIQDLDIRLRWQAYLEYIKETLEAKRSAIILMPDIDSVSEASHRIAASLELGPFILYRKQPKELDTWLKIAQAKEPLIVVGTRSAVFAPVKDLGLIIIDEESNMVYKQDQVPHYHARNIAFMRADIAGARVVLGATSPSLESMLLAKTGKRQYIFLPRQSPFPEIKIINTGFAGRKVRGVLSKYLQDCVAGELSSGGKVLVFLNRKGFATSASCMHCGIFIKCPRCNINLVYHFKDNILNCHYCNFKMSPPKICPDCNSGYIRYCGLGTEKLESELARLFPQAKIARFDDQGLDYGDAQIFISTQAIFKRAKYSFSLTCVISIDNSLNHIDFRSAEKTFALLLGLLKLTDKKMIIQTNLTNHHCFQALLKEDLSLFYEEELRQRKQLKFPPYQHLGLVKLRGKSDIKVKEAASVLFEKLLRSAKGKGIRVSSYNRAHPEKLRGSFYWQILVFAKDPRKISKFLKIYLKDFSHSGIIVTVDIDPI